MDHKNAWKMETDRCLSYTIDRRRHGIERGEDMQRKSSEEGQHMERERNHHTCLAKQMA